MILSRTPADLKPERPFICVRWKSRVWQLVVVLVFTLAFHPPACSGQATTTNLSVIWKLATLTSVFHTNEYGKNPFFLSSLPYKSSPKCVTIEGLYPSDQPYTWLVTSNGGNSWFDYGLKPFAVGTTGGFNRANITLPCPERVYTNGSNDWGAWLTNKLNL